MTTRADLYHTHEGLVQQTRSYLDFMICEYQTDWEKTKANELSFWIDFYDIVRMRDEVEFDFDHYFD